MFAQLGHQNPQRPDWLFSSSRTNCQKHGLSMPVLQVCAQRTLFCICMWIWLLSNLLFCVGASEPRNMAYMNRLGIWGEGTPFKEFSNFIQAVERRSVSSPFTMWLCEHLIFIFFLYLLKKKKNSPLCWLILEVLVPWKLLPWI